MSDCGSTEIRDLLPEYLHQRLTMVERAPIHAHLAECEECRLELAMLATVRDAMRQRTPAIDMAAIVRALPKTRRHRAVHPWMLQLAAALSFISVGGVSLLVARSFYNRGNIAVISDSAPPGLSSDTASPDGAMMLVASSGRHGLTVGGGVADLGTDEIEQLLGALESLEAVPSADPDELLVQEIPRAIGVR